MSYGHASYGQFADGANVLHIASTAREGRHTLGTYHIQNVSARTAAASKNGCTASTASRRHIWKGIWAGGA